jgi:hypothetical protein
MAYDFQTGASGALSGASSGAAIGGPVGAAVGGVVGLASGFFGGGNDETPLQDEAISRQRDLVNMLEGRYRTRQEQSATDTPLYESGMQQALERQREEANRDASQAAARGLQGSQFELAQDQQRSESLADFQQELLRGAVRSDRQRENQALQAMLNAEQNLTNTLMGASAQRQQQQARQNQMVQGALSGLGQTVAGMEGGPPLEDTLNDFFGGGSGGSSPFGSKMSFGIESY